MLAINTNADKTDGCTALIIRASTLYNMRRKACFIDEVKSENRFHGPIWTGCAGHVEADSPLRPAAPQSCPQQTWVAQQAPQAEPLLSPSSAGSCPATQSWYMSRWSTLHSWLHSPGYPVCRLGYTSSKNISTTHIFQLNVSPLIILKLREHIFK